MATSHVHHGKAIKRRKKSTLSRNDSRDLDLGGDENIDDGPLPWWSGFVWLPIFVMAFLIAAAFCYALWTFFF